MRDSWRLAVLTAGAASLVFVFNARGVLPAKYFYDSDYIADIAHGEPAFPPDRSYRVVAALYERLGLIDRPALTAVLELLLVVGAVLLAAPSTIRQTTGLTTVVLAMTSVGLGAVYLTQFSKDTVVLLLVLAILGALRTRFAAPVTLAGTLTYAAVFRTYWIVVAVLFVAAYVALRRLQHSALLVPVVLAMFATAAATSYLVRGATLDATRLAVNAGRAGSPEAVTLIAPFLEGPESPLIGLANAVLTLLALLFPLPLALMGSPLHVAAAVLICAYTIRLIGACKAGVTPGAESLRVAVALLIAFLVTQSLFAPDYGSYLKHLTPMLPLAVFAFAAADAQRRAPIAPSDELQDQPL